MNQKSCNVMEIRKEIARKRLWKIQVLMVKIEDKVSEYKNKKIWKINLQINQSKVSHNSKNLPDRKSVV